MEKKRKFYSEKYFEKQMVPLKEVCWRGFIRANEHNLLTNPENTINILHNTLH